MNTKLDVDKRRRQILLHLVGSSCASGAAVERLATRFDIPERTIRNDLEALKAELTTATEDLPETLLEAIGGADSYKKLQDLTSRLMAEMAAGKLDLALGQTLIDAITAQRHMIRAELEVKPQESVRALELLTPQEEALLADYRKKLAGPPVEPGVGVPPPPPRSSSASTGGGAS
jgi:hypothetical protein